MQRCPLVFVLVSVLALGLAGCGSGGGEPSPAPSSPAPTVSQLLPVPETSTPSAELYAEADRVYRAAMETQRKYEATGDYSEFPPELAEYFTPRYLGVVYAIFEDLASQGVRAPGDGPVMTTGPAPGVSKGESVVSLRTCYDMRGIQVLDAQGALITEGKLTIGVYYFEYHDSKLKIFSADLEGAETCPISSE